jgi:hypothetical protein
MGFFYPGMGGLWFLVLGWFLLTAARAEQTQTVLHQTLGDVPVSAVMTPDPVTAPADATVAQLLDDYVLATRHSAFPFGTGLAGWLAWSPSTVCAPSRPLAATSFRSPRSPVRWTTSSVPDPTSASSICCPD